MELERMVEPAGDLVGLEPLEVEANGLNAVGLPGADVTLLTAGGDFDLPLAEFLDVADDGADAPQLNSRKARSSWLSRAALIAGLGGEAEDAGARADGGRRRRRGCDDLPERHRG